MIQINNGSQEYEIIERDVQYFYKLGLNLKVVNKLNEVNIVFPDRQTLRTAIDTLVKSMHRQIATIPALLLGAGIIYWVNTPNVSAHSYEDNIITVEHQAGTLEIGCINDIQTEHHNQHLEYNWQANHLDEYIADKRLIYVSPDYTNNDFKREYSNWNNAINKARSGDVIIIEPGEYTISQLILKNNVDAIIKPGAVFNNTYVSQYGMFNCAQQTVNCKIFGEGVFNSEATTFYIDGDDSQVFIQFNEINSNNIFSIYCDNGSVYVKGYKLGNNRAFDSDAHCFLVDEDVLQMNPNGIGWYPSNNVQTYFYLRNAYMGICSECLYMENAGGDYDITVVNSKLEGDTGIQIKGAGEDHIPDVVRIWGSEIVANVPYINESGFDSEIYIYDDLVSSNTFPGSNYSFPNASPTVDAGLSLETNERTGDWSMWEPGNLTYELDENGFPVFTFDLIPNAIYYRIYENNALVGNCNFYDPSIKLGYKLTGDVALFRYEGIRNTVTSNLSNFILTTNIMALTNKPKPAKYDIGDTVYYNNAGSIETLTVKAKRVIVKNETGNSTGEQYNYYQFQENYNEILESRLYAGKGSLLAAMKGDFLNDVTCDVHNELVYDPEHLVNPLSDNIDGMNYSNVDFTASARTVNSDDYEFAGGLVDWCNFQNCTFPASVDTKSEFIAAVGSYDKKTTLFTDGYPIKDWNGLVFAGTENESSNCYATLSAFITFELKDKTKYNDWTFTFATGGSLSVNVNAETKTVAITYVNASTTIPQLITLLNNTIAFTTYFENAISGSNAVITRTTDFIYYAWGRDNLTSLDLTGLDCETTDFHYATMPTNADTKAEFKALVNAWDPVTTIWTDGEPIGE